MLGDHQSRVEELATCRTVILEGLQDPRHKGKTTVHKWVFLDAEEDLIGHISLGVILPECVIKSRIAVNILEDRYRAGSQRLLLESSTMFPHMLGQLFLRILFHFGKQAL